MRVRVQLIAVLVLGVVVATAARAEPGFPVVRLEGPGAVTGSSGAGVAFAGVSTGLPGWLRWALSPQLQLGPTPELTGLADRSYRGLAWTVPLASSVLGEDDRLSLGFSVGHSFGETGLGFAEPDPRSLRALPTTRMGAAIGYQVTPRLGLFVLFDRVSGGGLSREDEVANDLGIRMGLRF